MILIAIVALLILFTVISGAIVVRTQTAAIVERLGKYYQTLDPGFHIIIPYIDKVATRVPLRVQQNDLKVETKTKDNVFCQVNVSTQFRVNPKSVEQSYYELQSPERQIESYVQDAIRSAVPKLTLDEAFEKKDEIAQEVQSTISDGMNNYGFIIVSVLITEITPAAEVKKAMNEINSAQRQREAAQERAEAEKIAIVTKAKAKAEAAKLDGQGLADQRQAIVDGLASSLGELKATGIGDEQVLQLLLLNQYMNTMETIGSTNGNAVVFLPGGADATKELSTGLMSALKASKTINSNAINRSNVFTDKNNNGIPDAFENQ